MYQGFYKVKLFAGGGCLWNLGPGAIGFIVLDEFDNELERSSWRVGYSTNNRASYESLIAGLEFIQKYQPSYVNCFLENKLVVNQVNGWWSVKNPEIKKLLDKVIANSEYFKKVYCKLVKSTHPIMREVEELINCAFNGADLNNLI